MLPPAADVFPSRLSKGSSFLSRHLAVKDERRETPLMNLPQRGRSAHPVMVTNGEPLRRPTFHLRVGISLTFYVATFWLSNFFFPPRGGKKERKKPPPPVSDLSCKNPVALWQKKSHSVASQASGTLSLAGGNQHSLFGLLRPFADLPIKASTRPPRFASLACSAAMVYRITASGFTLPL